MKLTVKESRSCDFTPGNIITLLLQTSALISMFQQNVSHPFKTTLRELVPQRSFPPTNLI